MQNTPTPVAYTASMCGEAATWDADKQVLWWVDINRFLIHALHDGKIRSWDVGQPATALSLTTDQRLLVALRREIVLWDPESGVRQSLARLEDTGARFNDGRSDPKGRFVIGSMGDNVGPDGEGGKAIDGMGRLFRLDSTLTTLIDRLGIANTVCWSPDGSTLYFGDTLANEIQAFDYDAATGTISNPRPHLKNHSRGGPDGSAIDAEGFLWNCRWSGSCIVRVAPDGSIDRVIEMPTKNITTACFGGPDLSTLYVTTAAADTAPTDRLAGSVFAIETDTRGMPENRFDVAAYA